MAKLADILAIERERQEPDKWGMIHLFKTGSFYTAYEWSAWLTAVISYNDEVRKQTQSRMPLTVTRNAIASSEGETFCKVGFPLKSVEKFIPVRTGFEAIDDNHLVITIPLPQPNDGTEITYERLAEAVENWKEAQPIKATKEKQPSRQEPVAATATGNVGIIAQILSYPLSERTPLENIQFISSLKQQISMIL